MKYFRCFYCYLYFVKKKNGKKNEKKERKKGERGVFSMGDEARFVCVENYGFGVKCV